MNMPEHFGTDERVEVADSWSRSVTADLERSRRIAWIVACVAAAVALLLAIALVILLPLKTTVPYTLLVDRQTGYVEALAPLDAQVIGADEALTRSFLMQYVIARESFDPSDLQRNYRAVGLWSAGEARRRYLADMRSDGPANPLNALPPGARVEVTVRSVSSLGPNRSLVRFTSEQRGRSGALELTENWAAVIDWRYSGAEMSAEDRLVNPLGFQVTRYRKDPETLPEAVPVQPVRIVPRRSETPQARLPAPRMP